MLCGLETTFLLDNLPGFPAKNLAGNFLLCEIIQLAFEREDLLDNGRVTGVGPLNASAFIAPVKDRDKAFRVLAGVLDRFLWLKNFAAFGYYCPEELIWRAVWPRTDAPFGARVEPKTMLALNKKCFEDFAAESQELIASLLPPATPGNERVN